MNLLIRLLLPGLIVALPFSATHAIIVSYNYDAAGRLNAVNYNGTSRTAYGYDKNGNLLSRTNTTNPIPPLAATYNGLATNIFPNAVDIGPMTLKLNVNGSFSGKVTFSGVSYSFTGAFPASGIAPAIVIDRKTPLNDFTLNLLLDVAGGTQRITGNITDTTFVSDILLDRAGYNTTTQLMPAGLAGKYTGIFMPTEPGATIPQGDGYATVTVSSAGAIMLAGKLANNIGITHSNTLVGVASWPLFISLHANKGYLSGHVIFASNPGVSDFAGSSNLAWVKPLTTGAFHPAAFITGLNFLGSKYDPPVTGQRALAFPNTTLNATFTATEGNLAAPIVLNITLDAANKFVVPAPTVAPKLKLTLTTTTGAITGSFVDGAATRTVGGVVFQEQNIGSGFFPGSSVSGVIQIESNP